jgi:hypothetical protein
MAATPQTIILDPAKSYYEATEANATRARMLQETLGGVSSSIISGLDEYEKFKDQQQKRDLLSINTAGSLVGGVDKLPTDTLNRLPGILGVEMPRDANGNVVVTPDFQTVMNRQLADQVARDPSLALVVGGLMNKAPNPADLAQKGLDRDAENARNAATTKGENARNAATNAMELEKERMRDAADIKKANLASQGVDPLDMPSKNVMDPENGTVMSIPQYQITHPGKAVPPPMTYRDVKTDSDAKVASATVDAHNSDAQYHTALAMKASHQLQMELDNPNSKFGPEIKMIGDLVRANAGNSGPDAEKVRAMNDSYMENLYKRMGYTPQEIQSLTSMFAGHLANVADALVATGKGITASFMPPTAAGSPDASGNRIPAPVPAHPAPSGKPLTPQESLDYLNKP